MHFSLSVAATTASTTTITTTTTTTITTTFITNNARYECLISRELSPNFIFFLNLCALRYLLVQTKLQAGQFFFFYILA